MCVIPRPKYFVGPKTIDLGKWWQKPIAATAWLMAGAIILSHCCFVRQVAGKGYDIDFQIVEVRANQASVRESLPFFIWSAQATKAQ